MQIRQTNCTQSNVERFNLFLNITVIMFSFMNKEKHSDILVFHRFINVICIYVSESS